MDKATLTRNEQIWCFDVIDGALAFDVGQEGILVQLKRRIGRIAQRRRAIVILRDRTVKSMGAESESCGEEGEGEQLHVLEQPWMEGKNIEGHEGRSHRRLCL